MGSKLAFLLSLVFVIQVLLMGGDIFSAQLIHSEIDALAMTAAMRIAKEGGISDGLSDYVHSFNAEIDCLSACSPSFGETLTFRIYRTYQPIVIADQPIEISVKRSTVIGYYN